MAVGQGGWRTVSQALAGTNTTQRQIMHWVSKGWIKARGETGSGYTNEYDQTELKVMARMARLVHVGFRPEPAARIARLSVEQSVGMVTDADTGVMIVFKES